MQDLGREYRLRFEAMAPYREHVWRVLTAQFFQRFVPPGAVILDLGSGWGEFSRSITAAKKFAMDLNPDSAARVGPDVGFLPQDCSSEWAVGDACLDLVFTSNFFEHLPTKEALLRTLAQAYRCLKPGGRIVCLGPNIRFLPGTYWDFFDHYLPLSDRTVVEGLSMEGFAVEQCVPRFLPYSMSQGFAPPVWLLSLYLKLPVVWPLFGKQFLVVGRKPT